MMCSRVCRVSPHSQLMLFLGKNCFLNSPVYTWLVRHWIRWPNTSHWFCSSVKCLVGLRDGGILFAIANLPLWGAFCQSRIQAVCVVALAQRRANTIEVPIVALHASWVASLASSSALSFPFMLQWLGHHAHHPLLSLLQTKVSIGTLEQCCLLIQLSFYWHYWNILQTCIWMRYKNSFLNSTTSRSPCGQSLAH